MKTYTRAPYAFLACAVICLALLVSYIAHKSIKPHTLRVAVFVGSPWDVPENAPYHVIEAAIERFNEKHPETRVSFASGIRKGDYQEYLAGELVKGLSPDVFLVLREDFDRYADMGILEPLDAYLTHDSDIDTNLYYPALLDAGRIHGSQYALPLECAPKMMFVNTSLLTAEGLPLPKGNWTWQDLLTITEAVTKDADGDGRVDQFGIYGYSWTDAAEANGVRLKDRETWLSAFEGDAMRDAIRFTADLMREGEMHRARSIDFDAGRVAFRPFTFAEYRAYKPYPWSVKKYTTFSWDVLPMPKGERGDNRANVDVLLVAIAKDSTQKELAYAFLKELAYEEAGQFEILVNAMGLPTRRDIILSEAMDDVLYRESGEHHLSYRTIHDVLEKSEHLPHFTRAREAQDMATRAIEPLLAEPENAGEQLFELARSLRVLLAKD